MNPHRVSPEDFARIAALPVDHPDRVRAAQSPDIAAQLHLLDSFERPAADAAGHAEAADAGRELTARLARADAAGAIRFRKPMWRAPRWMLAAAVLTIVASSLWWTLRPAQRPVVRGESAAAGFGMLAPETLPDGIRLHWTEVEGAESYRVLLHGPDLRELGRLEVTEGTQFVLRRRDLPAGIEPGTGLLVQVEAVMRGDAAGRTPAQLIVAP